MKDSRETHDLRDSRLGTLKIDLASLGLSDQIKETRLKDLRGKLAESRKKGSLLEETATNTRASPFIRPARDRKGPQVQSLLLPDSQVQTITEPPSAVRKPEMRGFSVVRKAREASRSGEVGLPNYREFRESRINRAPKENRESMPKVPRSEPIHQNH